MSYATRELVESQYGATNVAKWADLNNNGDEDEVTARIDWALAEADLFIDSRLADGPYEIPFSDTPPLIASLAAKQTGVVLYESRGVSDFNAETGRAQHQLMFQKSEVEKTLRGIVTNKIRLVGVDQVSNPVPFIVNEDD